MRCDRSCVAAGEELCLLLMAGARQGPPLCCYENRTTMESDCPGKIVNRCNSATGTAFGARGPRTPSPKCHEKVGPIRDADGGAEFTKSERRRPEPKRLNFPIDLDVPLWNNPIPYDGDGEGRRSTLSDLPAHLGSAEAGNEAEAVRESQMQIDALGREPIPLREKNCPFRQAC